MTLIDVLDRTPGLLFTLVLIAFVLGSLLDSILTAKRENEKAKPIAEANKNI
ncbi:hypothetical protein PBCVNEJV1_559L [Paramecium bursaria Chlorella virus NE-JV-1]|nr:hypothetical protein PBCVNEJV1_559L [Paramecium bursaria Chlorella virus NE-JV-1]